MAWKYGKNKHVEMASLTLTPKVLRRQSLFGSAIKVVPCPDGHPDNRAEVQIDTNGKLSLNGCCMTYVLAAKEELLRLGLLKRPEEPPHSE